MAFNLQGCGGCSGCDMVEMATCSAEAQAKMDPEAMMAAAIGGHMEYLFPLG